MHDRLLSQDSLPQINQHATKPLKLPKPLEILKPLEPL